MMTDDLGEKSDANIRAASETRGHYWSSVTRTAGESHERFFKWPEVKVPWLDRYPVGRPTQLLTGLRSEGCAAGTL